MASVRKVILDNNSIEGFVGEGSVILINFRRGKWRIDRSTNFPSDIDLAARYASVQYEALTNASRYPQGLPEQFS